MSNRKIAEFVAEVLEVGKSYRGAAGTFVDLRVKNAAERPIISLPVSEETSRELGRFLYQNVYLALEIPHGNPGEPATAAPQDEQIRIPARVTPEMAAHAVRMMIEGADIGPNLRELVTDRLMDFRDLVFRSAGGIAGVPAKDSDARSRARSVLKAAMRYMLDVSP